jgi:hypothetical protein
MFRFALLVAADAQHLWTPRHSGGPHTSFHATSGSRLQFNLASVQVHDDVDEDGTVFLDVPGWAHLNVPGEPELPILRASMVLPRGASGQPHAVVTDVVKETVPLSSWGKRIKHSQGKCSLCTGCNSTVPRSEAAYHGVFPKTVAVTLEPVHTWRDVQGVVVEVQPFSVDHAKGVVEILHSCSIELSGMTVPTSNSKPAIVDPAFLSAHKFVYSNWMHFAHEYVTASDNGRVLVAYDQQFQSQAQTYADLVKQRLGSDVLMYQADSSASSIKNVISGHYKESAGLSYVTIIGRNVDAPTGSQTRKECDNCYAMMSGGVSLDLFVGRIGGSASEIETYLDKLKNYDSHSTAAWNKKAYGTAFNLAGDEYNTMTTIMSNLGDAGFTSREWDRDGQSSGQKSMSKMNSGLGVFSYIGHGSGTAWNTPSISVYDLERLTNTDMPFFVL